VSATKTTRSLARSVELAHHRRRAKKDKRLRLAWISRLVSARNDRVT
jgi:ribosomal protein L20